MIDMDCTDRSLYKASHVFGTVRREIHLLACENDGYAFALIRMAAIARNTFREAVRDRVLYNLVVFVLLLTACAIFIGELSADQETKVISDLGLSATLIFGAFIAIFVGTGLVSKEIERRTIYALLAKPVRRSEFIVGKYLGLCLTLFVNVSVMGVGIILALTCVKGGWNPNAANVVPALLMIYLELVILVSVTMLFSSFSSPALSALLAFGIFVIGNFSADMRLFAESLGSNAAKLFFGALFYLLPNLSIYSWVTPAGHGRVPSLIELLTALLYALLYSTIVLALASFVFQRRNFK